MPIYIYITTGIAVNTDILICLGTDSFILKSLAAYRGAGKEEQIIFKLLNFPFMKITAARE